ncbi:hypothetical protein [Streptomyces sp. GS7]|nr:hypothetical protein [Streptomyces sp. GS7]QHC23361.1 hypothetical protein GR130_20155 [Streptomyces sp. GS7]
MVNAWSTGASAADAEPGTASNGTAVATTTSTAHLNRAGKSSLMKTP